MILGMVSFMKKRQQENLIKNGGSGGSRTRVFKAIGSNILQAQSVLYILCLAGYRQTAYTKFGGTLFILDSSPSQFFCSLSTPQLLNEHPEQDGAELCCQQEGFFLHVTKLSENLVSFSYRRSHLHVNVIVGIYVFLIDVLRGQPSSSACNLA